jgi:hypothetical protein
MGSSMVPRSPSRHFAFAASVRMLFCSFVPSVRDLSVSRENKLLDPTD